MKDITAEDAKKIVTNRLTSSSEISDQILNTIDKAIAGAAQMGVTALVVEDQFDFKRLDHSQLAALKQIYINRMFKWTAMPENNRNVISWA